VTKTKVIYQVDTLLTINLDGYKPLVDVRPITDTAVVEAVTGTAISYIDPIRNKIVLQFLPKTFDVPIVINAKKTETLKIKEPVFKLGSKILLLAISFMMLMIGFFFWRIYKLLKLR
jgi:hypothetical protein